MLCLDCPDLDITRMPAGTILRARCCRDEHIDRRLSGQDEGWHGTDRAREMSDQTERTTQDNRRARRAARAKARRRG